MHWPNQNVPIKETLKGLTKLYKDGLVKSVGVSNFTIRHLQEAIKIAEIHKSNR